MVEENTGGIKSFIKHHKQNVTRKCCSKHSSSPSRLCAVLCMRYDIFCSREKYLLIDVGIFSIFRLADLTTGFPQSFGWDETHRRTISSRIIYSH